MSTNDLIDVAAQLADIRSMLIEMRGNLEDLRVVPASGRSGFTVDEAAALVDRSAYTVRLWCLEGRINATKRAERRGSNEVWNISAEEIARYKNEGLLPLERHRRAG